MVRWNKGGEEGERERGGKGVNRARTKEGRRVKQVE